MRGTSTKELLLILRKICCKIFVIILYISRNRNLIIALIHINRFFFCFFLFFYMISRSTMLSRYWSGNQSFHDISSQYDACFRRMKFDGNRIWRRRWFVTIVKIFLITHGTEVCSLLLFNDEESFRFIITKINELEKAASGSDNFIFLLAQWNISKAKTLILPRNLSIREINASLSFRAKF